MSPALAAVFLVLAAAGSAHADDDAAAREEEGRNLFNATCSSGYCHGTSGAGGGGPALRGLKRTREQIRQAIVEGRPGTSMLGLGRALKPDALEALVDYVVGLSGGADGPNRATGGPSTRGAGPDVPRPGEEATPTSPSLRGDAAAGRTLFFEEGARRGCAPCHAVQGVGGNVGPDLSALAARTPREIFLAIVRPRPPADPALGLVALTTRVGDRVVGVRRSEDAERVRLWDTSTVPPVSRAFPRGDVVRIESVGGSAMPADYGARLTLKELLDLVAFLRSAAPAAGSVSVDDLLATPARSGDGSSHP